MLSIAQERYQVKLPIFEGPLDLLLYFIEREEIPIYDIPIGKITEDFLQYLQYMRENALEIGGEFIAMASQLMYIKAKMLLPSVVKEEGDPRKPLVEQLLAHKQAKAWAQALKTLEQQAQKRFKRGFTEQEQQWLQRSLKTIHHLAPMQSYKLLKVYLEVLERFCIRHRPPQRSIKPYPYTVREVKHYILGLLRLRSRWHFEELLQRDPSRLYVVFTLLALLDLAQEQRIAIVVQSINRFWILAKAP